VNIIAKQQRLTAQTTTLAQLIGYVEAQKNISPDFVGINCARFMPHSFDRRAWSAARRGLCTRYAQVPPLRRSHMNAKEVLKAISDSAKPFRKVDTFSDLPGIYGVFFFGTKFPLKTAGDSLQKGSLIYIGKTESSQIERDLEQHFASGQTGRSTLRRSLGAIAREHLGLKPQPRNPNEKSDRKYRYYKFDAIGEERLTDWMKENLGLSFFAYDKTPTEIESLEVELIQLAVPILNLKNNPANRWSSEIKALRSVCAQLAQNADTPNPRIHKSPANTRRVVRMSDQLTLHEAMRIVLQESPGRTATFTSVAYAIAKRGLYSQKEGGNAPAGQIRLRARKYPHLFDIIPPDKVRLK
jgi:hypothetical protein